MVADEVYDGKASVDLFEKELKKVFDLFWS